MKNKTAYFGVFTSLALILSYVETLIPISFGIPGIKLGLANLVIVIVLYTYGGKDPPDLLKTSGDCSPVALSICVRLSQVLCKEGYKLISPLCPLCILPFLPLSLQGYFQESRSLI